MKKAFSIFLSLLVLTTSSGIAMTTHYCGGYMMDMEIALGHAHLDCGMGDMDQATECPGEGTHIDKSGFQCCDNISIAPETDNHNVQIMKKVSTELFVALAFSFSTPFTLPLDKNFHYTAYSPPLLRQDIPVLHQSFLL